MVRVDGVNLRLVEEEQLVEAGAVDALVGLLVGALQPLGLGLLGLADLRVDLERLLLDALLIVQLCPVEVLCFVW